MGLPTSSSHALFAVTRSRHRAHREPPRSDLERLDQDDCLHGGGPLLGFFAANLFMIGLLDFQRSTPQKMDVYFRKLQLVSAAAFSYAHGTNDAQKTMA